MRASKIISRSVKTVKIISNGVRDGDVMEARINLLLKDGYEIKQYNVTAGSAFSMYTTEPTITIMMVKHISPLDALP